MLHERLLCTVSATRQAMEFLLNPMILARNVSFMCLADSVATQAIVTKLWVRNVAGLVFGCEMLLENASSMLCGLLFVV